MPGSSASSFTPAQQNELARVIRGALDLSDLRVLIRQLQGNVLFGNGDPNGLVPAKPGTLYLNRSGGAGTTLYVKETGVDTDTGWVAK